MGNQAQVLPGHDVVEDAGDQTGPTLHARSMLLVVWTVIVTVPWALQVRSVSALVARHKITHSLVPPGGDNRVAITTASEAAVHCPVRGLHLAGVWYTIYSSHYYKEESGTLCHFTFPQYNAHGAYRVDSHKVKPMYGAPSSCTNDSYGFSYYYYHGGIGYYSLYTEGGGSFCRQDGTAYTVSAAVGSKDINLNALATYEGSTGYSSSYYYGGVGTAWLAYRAVVLARSYLLCWRFATRLDTLRERISVSDAVVYIQQAARLVPHTATNWHRLGLVYLLLEGLMTDLFLVVAYEGSSAKVQYISLGYNIAGVLSMLFEMLEHSTLAAPSTRLALKRVLFNNELGLWGELLFSILITFYVTALNRSALGPTPQVAEAVSHYLWGLVNHAVIVLGHLSFIVTVRILGTLVYVRWRFGSLRMLTMPCCVDSVMGDRCKLVKLSGYELHDSRLCYTKQALKAHGLFMVFDEKGSEYLVCDKIHWLPSATEDWGVIGKLTGEHVDPWSGRTFHGSVAVCDRRLGGTSLAMEERELVSSDAPDHLENACLLGSIEESSGEN